MKAIRLLPDRMPVHKKTGEVNIRSAIVKERNRIAYLILPKIHGTFSKFGKEIKTKCKLMYYCDFKLHVQLWITRFDKLLGLLFFAINVAGEPNNQASAWSRLRLTENYITG